MFRLGTIFKDFCKKREGGCFKWHKSALGGKEGQISTHIFQNICDHILNCFPVVYRNSIFKRSIKLYYHAKLWIICV